MMESFSPVDLSITEVQEALSSLINSSSHKFGWKLLFIIIILVLGVRIIVHLYQQGDLRRQQKK